MMTAVVSVGVIMILFGICEIDFGNRYFLKSLSMVFEFIKLLKTICTYSNRILTVIGKLFVNINKKLYYIIIISFVSLKS